MPESLKNYCADGGYVGGGDCRVPIEPAEFYFEGALDVIGCSNLVCSNCGFRVRQQADLDVEPGTAPAELYKLAKWDRIPLRRREGLRVYACQCGWFVGSASRPCGLEEWDPIETNLPWRCGGHPIPVLPLTYDGWAITASTDFTKLARESFRRDVPGSGEHQGLSGIAWVIGLHGRLAGHPCQSMLGNAIAGLLGH